MKLFLQKNAKFLRAGGSAPRPPCLRWLEALPPTPIGFQWLPLKQPPPIANFWLRACFSHQKIDVFRGPCRGFGGIGPPKLCQNSFVFLIFTDTKKTLER